MIGHVISPMLVRSPSAIVLGGPDNDNINANHVTYFILIQQHLSPVRGIRVLPAKDLAQSSALAGSAANIFTSGRVFFTAMLTPLIKPPPPTGTKIASACGT